MNYLEYEVKKIDIENKLYPQSLRKIKNPPKVLFYKGNPKILKNKKTVAIVGSRCMTNYGLSVIDRFVSGFVESGIITISGFMYGVDTEVHKKTIEYGGTTIAVFGCGLNVCYPPENDKLYVDILESGGLVLSEYEPDSKPHLWKFPQRNRIVAGLSKLGVLVIEAGEKSGSLITAKLGRDQGKKVYAVPGPITSSVSAGTNWLIKSGNAIMLTSPEDFPGGKEEKKLKELNLSPLESQIYNILKRESLSIDELSAILDKNIVELSEVISLMSVRGLITEIGGKFCL